MKGLMRDPAVWSIIVFLANEIRAWVRGAKPRPRWLDVAAEDVPSLKAPVALAEAKARAAKGKS